MKTFVSWGGLVAEKTRELGGGDGPEPKTGKWG